MVEVEKIMAEIVLALVEDFLSEGSEEPGQGPSGSGSGSGSGPKRRRLDYQMERRDYSLVPHIPGMDWANCSWANPWDSLYPATASSDI